MVYKFTISSSHWHDGRSAGPDKVSFEVARQATELRLRAQDAMVAEQRERSVKIKLKIKKTDFEN